MRSAKSINFGILIKTRLMDIMFKKKRWLSKRAELAKRVNEGITFLKIVSTSILDLWFLICYIL